MSKERSISNRQLKSMLFMFTLGTYIVAGSVTVGKAGKDVLIAIILALGITVGFCFVLAALQQRFPGKDLADYNTIVFGKFAGTTINIIYLIYFFFLEILTYGNLVFIFTTLFFTRTPIWAFGSSMNSLSIVINLAGLEAIARMAEFTSPILFALIGITTLGALISPGVDFTNLLPIGTSGIIPILEATRNNLSFPLGEIVAFAMFLHLVEKPRDLRKDLIKGIFFGIGLLLIAVIRNIIVFGGLLEIFTYPSAMVVRHIHIGGFIERIEPIIVIGWFFTIFLKAAISLYVSVAMASKITGIKNKLYLIIPIVVTGHIIGIMMLGTEFQIRYVEQYIYPWMFILQMGVPLLLLIISIIRGLGVKEQNKEVSN